MALRFRASLPAASEGVKSVAVTLATWAILFALVRYGAHELFYPPGDWISVPSYPRKTRRAKYSAEA